MNLYIAPGACSLADHIAMHEAALDFDCVKVDLKARRTEDGRDYNLINPKGYVPALQLDDGQVLTENVAILTWIADQDPSLAPAGPMGRYRLLEALAYINGEIHKAFKPFFDPGSAEAQKAAAGEAIDRRLGFLAGNLKDDYLFGDRFSVADAYLFVMGLWAQKNGLPLPDPLSAFVARMKARPAVLAALQHEGLTEPTGS
jgi:glutathione S-transferase